MSDLVNKKAILFDLDGTLWDALDTITEAWNKAMKDNNLNYRFSIATMKSFMGLTPRETAPLAFKDVSLEKGLEYFSLCLNEEIKYLRIHPGKLYEDEEEVLKVLQKDFPLFIVSNSDKGYIEDYIEAYKFNKYFIDHVCAGDTNLEKWQNILYIKNKYNLEDIIYVGDTLKDQNESNKAGVKFIHAAYGFGEIKEEVNKINSLKELPDLVKKVFKS